MRLRLLVINQHNFTNPAGIEKVEIYTLDSTFVTPDNPEGRRLVRTVAGADVQQDDVGKYHIDVVLTDPVYTIGRYYDVWTIQFEGEPNPGTVEFPWKVYPDLWFTSPTPIVYDYQFRFQPNRIRKGSKKYLRIEIVPQVPTGSDLAKFYENLAIVGEVKIWIEQACGPCVPAEADLRVVVDGESVPFREKRHAFYHLDTEDLDCGIYNVWFELTLADNVYLSDKYQLQLYP